MILSFNFDFTKSLNYTMVNLEINIFLFLQEFL